MKRDADLPAVTPALLAHRETFGTQALHGDFQRRTIRGGAITLTAQFIKIGLTLGSTIILARLLTPADYGLIAMVTAITGLVEILKDGGLSLATVQRDRITEEQISTLFWLNLCIGGVLMLITLALGPLVSHFYGEPRLTGITTALAITFLLGGLTVQHQALLRRNLRFTTLAVIDVASIGTGLIVAIVMAEMDYSYWALVGMAIGTATVNAGAVWIALPWRPGRYRFNSGVRPMIGFGSNIVGTRFIHSFIRYTPNILLGWYWGAFSVGLYQRAYALVMFAVDQIQGPITSVILPSLSRLQGDPARLKQFFLSGYAVIVSAILPVVVTCAVYADEIVHLLLGPQWTETAVVFRWLALSGIFIGLLHPLGMLLVATGNTGRCVKIALADAAVTVAAYIAGVHFGAIGIAVSFLAAKLVTCFPLIVMSLRGTVVTGRDVFTAIKAPLIASTVAGLTGILLKELLAPSLTKGTLAIFGCLLAVTVYTVVLLFGLGKWPYYRSVFEELRAKKILAPQV